MRRALGGLDPGGLLPRAGVLGAACALLVACFSDGITPGPLALTEGTWGGENAGLIVADTVAHAHVGCTYGNFHLPVQLERSGRFETEGSYVLRAYPIAIGPSLPARMSGTLDGAVLTFTVTVTDTVQGGNQVLGPATVTLGVAPQLGPCPICAVVPALGP